MSEIPRNEGRVAKSRYREHVTLRVGGFGENKNPSYGPVGQQYGGSSYKVRDRRMTDYINKPFRDDGTFSPSPLTIVDRTNRNYFVDGENRNDSVKHLWVATWSAHSSPRGGAWTDYDEGDESYALKLLARTNPMAPLVMIPELIVELIEAVTVARFRVKTSLFNPGSLHLTKSFGVDTLVEDIRVLNNVVKHVEKRLKRFSSLNRHGGLRARAKLDKHTWPSHTATNVVLASSAWSYAKGTIVTNYTQEVYGSCRWRLKADVPYDPEIFESFSFALQQVLDLEKPDLNTIWNLIPWSWVVDYFSSIGDYYQSKEGSDLIEPYDVCIMRERTATAKHQITQYGIYRDLACTGKGKPQYRSRHRSIIENSVELTPTTGSPRGGQVVNLIALLVQRFF